MRRLPHPIPYQGSKRNLAAAILAVVNGRKVRRLYEPFAGSAAITIASANAGGADGFVIADTLSPLVEIWRCILTAPTSLADKYERIWNGQRDADERYYSRMREAFNRQKDPAKLLYLLARCVKNSPRWNRDGAFNQSEDKRRLGMRPEKMRREIEGVHRLLAGKAEVIDGDFEETTAAATPRDLVYMDPPWEGTSGRKDTRYHQGLHRERLVAALESLNRRGVPWILSYDGRCGTKTYGSPLPKSLGAVRMELEAGRSSQATLNGVDAVTVESLYVSASLCPPQRKAVPRQRQRVGCAKPARGRARPIGPSP